MKTHKLTTALLVLLCSAFLTSCNNESVVLDGSSTLVGHWYGTSNVSQYNYVFNADATGQFFLKNCQTGDVSSEKKIHLRI